MSQNKLLIVVALAIVGLLIGASSVYTVNEREQAVVVRFGEIVHIDETPGLQWKLPLIDRVYPFNLRLLTLNEEVPAVRTSDEKEVVADLFVKWRIVDVRQYYPQESNARNFLQQAVTRRLGDEFSKRTLAAITGGDWRQLTESIASAADKDARKIGVEIVDVRLQRVGVPVHARVFDRMRKQQTDLAKERIQQGSDAADRIKADAEQVRDVALAEGHAKAERIRGEGEARAAAIHAKAAAVAPEFYSFYQSLNAYKEVFKKKEDVMVLDPSSDFFKYMKKPTR